MDNSTDNRIYIPLSKTGKHAGRHVAIVDSIDVDLTQHNWHILQTRNMRYAMRKVGNKDPRETVLLHRVILSRKLGRDLLADEWVDHIDGNGLNNCRYNLRVASREQNQQNRGQNKNSTSGLKGVYWNKQRNKWQSSIYANGKSKHLGLFDTKEEAYAAYCKAAKELHGEFANYGKDT